MVILTGDSAVPFAVWNLTAGESVGPGGLWVAAMLLSCSHGPHKKFVHGCQFELPSLSSNKILLTMEVFGFISVFILALCN